MTGTPPRFPLSYRASQSGRVIAAYAKNVRVGYVEQRPMTELWLAQLIVLRPEGGAYLASRLSSEEEAKEFLEQSFHHWICEAGLQICYNRTERDYEPEQRGYKGSHRDDRDVDQASHRTGLKAATPSIAGGADRGRSAGSKGAAPRSRAPRKRAAKPE